MYLLRQGGENNSNANNDKGGLSSKSLHVTVSSTCNHLNEGRHILQPEFTSQAFPSQVLANLTKMYDHFRYNFFTKTATALWYFYVTYTRQLSKRPTLQHAPQY